mgnify:FL=1|tara:strand:- start:90 stop:494 length:405 start_codon:yes stop_codon:yes gene_type:complete
MKNKFSDLVTFDDYRLTQLFEIIQFSVLYIIICLVTGIYLDYLFPDPDENKSTLSILLELSFHSVIVALSVFYIRKICHLFPLMFKIKNFREIHTREYDGEIIVAIVFFTTQKKIFEKINILHKRFLTGIDKDA